MLNSLSETLLAIVNCEEIKSNRNFGQIRVPEALKTLFYPSVVLRQRAGIERKPQPRGFELCLTEFGK